MRWDRRTFLKYMSAGTATVFSGTALWIAKSKRRTAYWGRQIIADARRTIAPAPVKPEPAKWSDNKITMCWVGHATVLINFYGMHILTDPVFGKRVGISLGLGTAGPKRYIAPGLLPDDLPPIDVILMSHAHMDHMDIPSLRRLPKDTFTVTPKLTGDVLAGARLKNITELSWKESATF